jgi:hypothetical protein
MDHRLRDMEQFDYKDFDWERYYPGAQELAACAGAAVCMEEGQALPDEILQAFEEAWVLTKEGAFPYWRSYSADMPNRESLDQGASYAAAKKKTLT